jgi:alkaline phosphatase
MQEDGVIGLSMTHASHSLVADSASSASQLATGKSAGSEMIGLDAAGHKVDNVITVAKQAGKLTGLVSDTQISHATPAAFSSHQLHRDQENNIAEDSLSTGVDVMLSGGLRH